VAPGNTAAAFEHAVSLGYTYLETDVQLTADGVLVLFHDIDLEPTTGVDGTIETKSWDEVSRIRIDGHPIPRFLDMVDRFPGVRWNAEPKTDVTVDPLLAAIQDHGLVDRVCVGSFAGRRVRRVRAVLGDRVCRSPGPLAVGAILVTAAVWPRWRPPFGALQLPRRYGPLPLVTGGLVDRVHRMGLQVHVWTINDEAEMDELYDLGVDAVMTDNVGTLREVLARRGHWPQPS
jgi:glycerophosphoryl diester phosphodiesterase